ncbi:MAG TPA: hypothetical protein VJU15_08120 [Gemmatimonadales bacterium]|nr:hypothetical protein [Gemmatimonadales bacterium]
MTDAGRGARSASRYHRLDGALAQYLNDHVVLAAVDEVETVATGISGKIWQKIVILDTVGK